MSAPMTPERLAEIRNRRLNEVTAGPWLVADDEHGHLLVYVEREGEDGGVLALPMFVAHAATEADTQFVVSARRSVPELLAEVDRLQAQVAAVLALHRKYTDSDHCEYDGEVWPCPTVEALATPPVTDLAKAVDVMGALPMPAGADDDSHEAKVAEYLSTPYTDDSASPEAEALAAVDRSITAQFPAVTAFLAEDPHDSPLHQSYATPRDLPEIPAQRDGGQL